MITIQKSKTADTRTCDFANVSKETLCNSSIQHISDIRVGLRIFEKMLWRAGIDHDADKLTGIESFHSDFITGFKITNWWDNHRRVNRHHLLQSDGVPADVNLIDVIEMIVDCVMAGMGRAGKVYPLDVKPELLKQAFDNTAKLLENQITVEDKDGAVLTTPNTPHGETVEQ